MSKCDVIKQNELEFGNDMLLVSDYFDTLNMSIEFVNSHKLWMRTYRSNYYRSTNGRIWKFFLNYVIEVTRITNKYAKEMPGNECRLWS